MADIQRCSTPVNAAENISFETPKKVVTAEKCFVCSKPAQGQLRRVCANVTSPEKSEVLTDIRNCFGISSLPDSVWSLKICIQCKKTLSNCLNFKQMVENGLTQQQDEPVRYKRRASTPTPKKNEQKRRNRSVSPVVRPNSKRSLNFQTAEHSYSDGAPQDLLKSVSQSSAARIFSASQTCLEAEDREALQSVINDPRATCKTIAKAVLGDTNLRSAAETLILGEINATCMLLCSKTILPGPSVLRSLQSPSLLIKENILTKAVLELQNALPFVYDIFRMVACSPETSRPNTDQVVGMMYASAMHNRNKDLAAIQKINTAVALRHHAGNGLLSVFNKIGVTLATGSKYKFLDDLGKFNMSGVIKSIKEGKKGKMTCDNVDGTMIANQVRLEGGNKHYHYTASTYYPERIDLSHLSMHVPDVPRITPHLGKFYLSMEEETSLKAMYGCMIGRILVEYLPAFQWMAPCIPKHIPHEYSAAMTQKTEIHPLKLVLKDPKFYKGCIRVLDEMVKVFRSCYDEAGKSEEFDQARVILGGDQLVRVRMCGACDLRAGARNREQKFDMFKPIMTELFHVEQDFLEIMSFQKMIKRFYDSKKERVQGTLQNYKTVLNRKNVNGRVKIRFKAHEDFVHTVGNGLMLTFCMSKFHMQETHSKPNIPGLPDNIGRMQIKNREPFYRQIVGQLVDALFTPFRENEDPRQYQFELPLENGERQNIAIPANFFANRPFVFLQVENQWVRVEDPDAQDLLHNYNLQFLQWYLHLLEYQDGVREGDPFRTNVNLKRLIPFFYSHDKGAHYAVECIDYIQKTEILLPEALAMRARLGSFVNPHGKEGGNKAADMQQENNILVLKDVIKGLGAGKTDKALVRSSMAAPVLQDIVENFKSVLHVHKRDGSHTKRSDAEDVHEVLRLAMRIRPFEVVPGRGKELPRGLRIDPFRAINRGDFHAHLDEITERLHVGIDVQEHDESDDDEDEENQEEVQEELDLLLHN